MNRERKQAAPKGSRNDTVEARGVCLGVNRPELEVARSVAGRCPSRSPRPRTRNAHLALHAPAASPARERAPPLSKSRPRHAAEPGPRGVRPQHSFRERGTKAPPNRATPRSRLHAQRPGAYADSTGARCGTAFRSTTRSSRASSQRSGTLSSEQARSPGARSVPKTLPRVTTSTLRASGNLCETTSPEYPALFDALRTHGIRIPGSASPAPHPRLRIPGSASPLRIPGTLFGAQPNVHTVTPIERAPRATPASVPRLHSFSGRLPPRFEPRGGWCCGVTALTTSACWRQEQCSRRGRPSTGCRS